MMLLSWFRPLDNSNISVNNLKFAMCTTDNITFVNMRNTLREYSQWSQMIQLKSDISNSLK